MINPPTNRDSMTLKSCHGSSMPLVSVPMMRYFPGNVFECRALVCPEEEGGFSSFALRLPGVASQGETEDEALLNLKEAFRGTLAAYLEGGMEIPWGDVTVDHGTQGKERWMIVDVQ
jgi:predicted RNase H-like HicB family nuclease